MIYEGNYRVTQIYKGKDHQGVDLVGLTNKDIFAPVSGLVVAAQYDPYFDGGMGLYIKIFGDDDLYHLLAHNSAVFVKPGQRVLKGGKIGIEGDTGHSFGSHCHYEIRRTLQADSYIDVCNYMKIPNKLGVYESEVKMSFNTALEVLIKYGIIKSPDYWVMCSKTTKYIEELVINTAKALLKTER